MNVGKLIGQGRTAEVYELEDNKILKLYKQDFPKTAIEHEYKVSSALVNNDIPSPKVYELIEHDNRSGIIYEKISGATMMKIMSAKPWKIAFYAKKLAELHCSIQKTIDCDLPEYKDKLLENINITDLLSDDIKKKLNAYIDTLGDGNILCHGDFHPDNIIMSAGKSIVIDWMTATKGDPLADVARTVVLFKYAAIPEEKSFIEKKIIGFVRNKFLNEYLKHYIKISCAKPADIEKWELPIAAARLIEWVPKSEKERLIKYIRQNL